jgi:unsaturated chondroitin disaccharide hydrolase
VACLLAASACGGPVTPGAPAVDAASAALSAAPTGCQPRRFGDRRGRAALRLTYRRLARAAREVPVGAYPSITDHAGVWQTTGPRAWTSGFFPGSLWLAYRRTRRPAFETWAERWTHGLAGQSLDTSTHDVGFQILDSFGHGYDLTHRPRYLRIARRGARSLASRYSPTVHAIRSWGPLRGRHHFKVVVDNMMNLELLLWASRHGGPRSWTGRAVQHARTTVTHFLRRDGSVRHLVDFDPTTGGVLAFANPQGYRPGSTWSRGQAWAIRGFATAYAYTHRAAFLSAARRTARYYLTHVPADCVAYWDFDAPDIPDAPRDASAAAVAADGLEELAAIDPSSSRRRRDDRAAGSVLRSLADHYTAAAGQAVLDGSVATYGVDPPGIGTAYGDYFYLEAMEARLRQHR